VVKKDRTDIRLIRSVNSKVVHTPGCLIVRRMKRENRRFIENVGDLRPCTYCNGEYGQAVYL
jgi:hypothetical protein